MKSGMIVLFFLYLALIAWQGICQISVQNFQTFFASETASLSIIWLNSSFNFLMQLNICSCGEGAQAVSNVLINPSCS